MNEFTELIDIIKNSSNIVFFGGAGVSTESGIPDFRGKSGIYTTAASSEYSPEEMLHRSFFERYPERFMQYYRDNMIFPKAKPNAAHIALAKLEEIGKLSAVITQNIDGLHQLAGSKNVIELHGSTLRNYCIKCGAVYGIEKITGSTAVPVCDKCGGMIRPDVVLYGESLKADSLYKAGEEIINADVLVVGGTSLTVHPAADLVADYTGDHLIIINRSRTPYDRYAELVIREPIAEVFESILEKI